jgi:hypothetical protein
VQLDEKTLEALLQVGIGHSGCMRRIGGRGYVHDLGCVILVSEIPLLSLLCPNQDEKIVLRQCLPGSLFGANPS